MTGEQAVLAFEPPSDAPAIVLYCRLHDAVRRADYQSAARLRRQLYREGWSVVPLPEAREKLLAARAEADRASRLRSQGVGARQARPGGQTIKDQEVWMSLGNSSKPLDNSACGQRAGSTPPGGRGLTP
jgi:hypothetical protein